MDALSGNKSNTSGIRKKRDFTAFDLPGIEIPVYCIFQTISISLYLPQIVYFCNQYKLKLIIMSDIATRVKKIIVDKLGVDEAEVTPEASFTNDLGADSLDTVELIMEFEKEFNISIPDEQAETITTVGQANAYLEEHAK